MRDRTILEDMQDYCDVVGCTIEQIRGDRELRRKWLRWSEARYHTPGPNGLSEFEEDLQLDSESS